MDRSVKIGALSFVATVCILALPSLAGAQEAGEAAAQVESSKTHARMPTPDRD